MSRTSECDDSDEEYAILAFHLKKIKLKDNQVGIAAGRSPAFDFNVGPYLLTSQNASEGTATKLNDAINIKVKLKSRKNPNYIKLLGAACVNTTHLQDSVKDTWFDLYQLKDGKGDVLNTETSIGKIRLHSCFLETSSYDSSEKAMKKVVP